MLAKHLAGRRSRMRVREALESTFQRAEPPSDPPADVGSLGLPLAEVVAACDRFGLTRIAESSGLSGSEERLQAVALIGSMLADIGYVRGDGGGPDALLDGALVNVAVTLTDRLVDDNPRLGSRAAESLSPSTLIDRLRNPTSPSHALAFADAGPLAPFYALWDAILTRAGGRLADRAEQISYVGSMLALMHESEVGRSADRFPAKVLPIEFIGAIAGCSPDSRTIVVYRELGSLLALADDWQDLADDIVRVRANQFVTDRDRGLRHLGRHLTGSIRRIARPMKLREEAAVALAERIERTLVAARAAGPQAYRKTYAFLGYIFAFSPAEAPLADSGRRT